MRGFTSRIVAVGAAVALLGAGCARAGIGVDRYDRQPPQQRVAPTAQNQAAASSDSPGYELVVNSCTEEQCLFNINQSFYPIGAATIQGHFITREVAPYGEKKSCDSFVVTGGANEFIRAILALVNAGNTVNAKNEKNQPIVNLSLDGLTADEKQMIQQSNGSQEVSLVIIKELQPGDFGAPACFSDFKIVRVSKP